MTRLRNDSIKCDGCGRLSADQDGYYTDASGTGGHINSHGRSCEHDYCDQCEDKLALWPACPLCGRLPDPLAQRKNHEPESRHGLHPLAGNVGRCIRCDRPMSLVCEACGSLARDGERHGDVPTRCRHHHMPGTPGRLILIHS